MDNSAAFLSTSSQIGFPAFAHLEKPNSDIFMLQLKLLTENTAPPPPIKMAPINSPWNKLFNESFWGINLSQHMAQQRSWDLAENSLLYLALLSYFDWLFCMYTISRQHLSRSSLYWPCSTTPFPVSAPCLAIINCWWEANSISMVPLKKLVVALFIWQNSPGRGERSLSNPFLSVWRLFSSASHCIQPFLVVSNCSYFWICKSYNCCIFPGRTNQIGFEKIILLFGFVLLFVLVVKSQKFHPLCQIQMIVHLFYVLKSTRFHSNLFYCLVPQPIHESAVMVASVRAGVSVRIVECTNRAISV